MRELEAAIRHSLKSFVNFCQSTDPNDTLRKTARHVIERYMVRNFPHLRWMAPEPDLTIEMNHDPDVIQRGILAWQFVPKSERGQLWLREMLKGNDDL